MARERLIVHATPPGVLVAVVLAPTPVITDAELARLAFVAASGAVACGAVAVWLFDVLLLRGLLAPDATVARHRVLAAVVWAGLLVPLASLPGATARALWSGVAASLLVAGICGMTRPARPTLIRHSGHPHPAKAPTR